MKNWFDRFFSRYNTEKNGLTRPLLTSVPTDEAPRPIKEKLSKSSKPKKIKIAVDQSIGNFISKKLEDKGYQIVCRANSAEPDSAWLKRACDNGALFVISPDLDIPSLIEKENYPMIWIDFLYVSQIEPCFSQKSYKSKKNIWATYIHDRIQSKMNFFQHTFSSEGKCVRL